MRINAIKSNVISQKQRSNQASQPSFKGTIQFELWGENDKKKLAGIAKEIKEELMLANKEKGIGFKAFKFNKNDGKGSFKVKDEFDHALMSKYLSLHVPIKYNVGVMANLKRK